MKYCKATTEGHPALSSYGGCLENINDRISKEDKFDVIILPIFTSGETIINLDDAEEKSAIATNRTQQRSMDFAFGVINNSGTKQMVLTELKLNVRNPNNTSTTELSEKVAGSLALLSDSIPVCSQYYFIYHSDVTEEARNRFYRLFSKANKNYNVIDIHELKATFF